MSNILVIDNDINSRTVLQKRLKNDGYHVSVADNGKDGLVLFYKNPVKLIITEMSLPVKSGMDTIIEIQTYNSDTRVIALSEAEQELTMAQALGVNDTFIKPLNVNDLLEAVRENFQ